MAKVLSIKQVKAKRFDFLPNLPPHIEASFGELTSNHQAIIYGKSGNGKSSLNMYLSGMFATYGKVLYVALEEGHSATTQENIIKYLPEDLETGFQIADNSMTYEELISKLSKRNSPKFIFIDSIQYLNIKKEQYQALKKRFPRKSFYYISHSKGKSPDGSLACYVEYDVDIKVYVEGFVAFVRSRLKKGVPKPYVIWEAGAKKYWKKEYQKIIK